MKKWGLLAGESTLSELVKLFLIADLRQHLCYFFSNTTPNSLFFAVLIGPMIWYQKFEYAVSHWLQKATEHLIGCVLCSPGCFSLFRASALMDDNVMRKYATTSSNARHYIQFDQGNIDVSTCMDAFENKEMNIRFLKRLLFI